MFESGANINAMDDVDETDDEGLDIFKKLVNKNKLKLRGRKPPFSYANPAEP